MRENKELANLARMDLYTRCVWYTEVDEYGAVRPGCGELLVDFLREINQRDLEWCMIPALDGLGNLLFFFVV